MKNIGKKAKLKYYIIFVKAKNIPEVIMKVLTVKCRGYFGVLKSLDHISYGYYDIVLQNVETNADIELHAVTLGEMDTEKTSM